MNDTTNETKPLTADQLAVISKRWTVKEPYYLAICLRCGTVATSEIFGLDGETIYCPRCQSDKVEEVSQDRFPVLGLLATIAAQARLLALAETLVETVRFRAEGLTGEDTVEKVAIELDQAFVEYRSTGIAPCPGDVTVRKAVEVIIDECVDGMIHEDPDCPCDDTCECENVARVQAALECLEETGVLDGAALTEYQTTGTVPCKRCAEAEAELSKLLEYGFPPTGTVPCGECERLQSNLKQADHNHSLMYANLRRVEADNTDLRRQLIEAKEQAARDLQALREMVDVADKTIYDLRSQLSDTRKHLDESIELGFKHRDAIEPLTADNTALREAYNKAAFIIPNQHCGTCGDFVLAIHAASGSFSQPHPGAALLEELVALRAVADAADAHLSHGDDARFSKPTLDALAEALDAIRGRQA